ncbi:Histone acetyltransferase complex subunit, partial [Nowakowskiella sp. JEL0078]
MESNVPEQEELFEEIQREFKKAEDLADQKIKIAQKGSQMLEKYFKKLKQDLDRLSSEEQLLNMNGTSLSLVLNNNVGNFSNTMSFTDIRPESPMRDAFSYDDDEMSIRIPSMVYSPTPDNSRDVSPEDVDEALYCFCRQVSFGEMVACDDP